MVNLHVHTKYSLLDSTIDIDALIEKMDMFGQNTIAITDHGNMYGTCEAYQKLTKAGKKCIIGCECYICEDRFQKGDTYHLILLAKNEEGRLNLQKLVSESTKHKYRGKPRIDFQLLSQHHMGLVCLSACMAGEVASYLMDGKIVAAKRIAYQYKELFGEDYYLEYQSHMALEQQKLNALIVDIANEMDIDYVVTCDAHFLNNEDQKYHSVFVQVGQSREVGETYNDCFFQSDADVLTICQSTTAYNQKAIDNTKIIADKCNASYPLSAPIIPHFNVPASYKDELAYMQYLCNQGFADRELNRLPKEEIAKYKKRAKYELDAVSKMGFEGYYLLVWDYVMQANKHGIARGSAGGTLLAYLMGIVDIDPIKYGLYFERFIDVGALDLLNSEKITRRELKIPDVDTDVAPSERDSVMQYIVNKYGEDKVVSIGQFTYIWAKGAIKDIGKVLNIPFDIRNEITKNLNDETIDEALESGLLDRYKDQYPELFEYASKLAGLPKSFGLHPCGKIIAMRNADYYNALEYSDGKDVWVLQGDMHTADALGLVKIDLLGLRTLDILYDTLEMIGETYDYIAPAKIDMEDKAVWAQFAEGNTNTIFQFESRGMKETLKGMHCDGIMDLGVANALYRPGAMQYISNYIQRKHGEEKVVYLHPDLEPILSSTYGVIVFQEQLIDIGRLAQLGNPDELRQATAKKKPVLMAKIEPEMKNGLMQRGWSQSQIDDLWNDILKFAKYSFGKAHAMAYAITAYISMYLKVHHPVEYMTACINSYDGNFSKIVQSILEAKNMGIAVGFDNWRNVQTRTTCRDGQIYLGLNTLSGFGNNVAEALRGIGQRDDLTFIDLVSAMDEHLDINKTQAQVLIKLDFFKEYGSNGKLLQMYKLFQDVYTAKVFSKDKLPVPEEIVRLCARETDKQYRDIDNQKLFNILCETQPEERLAVSDAVNTQIKHMGYITYTDAKLFKYYVVMDMNTKYSPKVKVYSLYDGTVSVMKIPTATYTATPFNKGAILKVLSSKPKERTQLIDGKWCKIIGEFETWIYSYVVKGGVDIE